MLNPWILNFVNLYPNVSHLLSGFVKIHVHYIVIEYIYCIYIIFSSYIVFLNYLFIKINIIIKSIFFEIYFIGENFLITLSWFNSQLIFQAMTHLTVYMEFRAKSCLFVNGRNYQKKNSRHDRKTKMSLSLLFH